MTNLRVQSLLLADMIYQDRSSSKYVIAGTFHQLHVTAFPTTFGRTLGLFVSLLNVQDTISVGVEFVDEHNGAVLMRTQSLEVTGTAQATPVEFALEVPRLPLPHAGLYLFRLLAEGMVVGVAPLYVQPVYPTDA